jgi:tRNA threonylcarbamoyladenosine biosynthesis protein TsaE
VTKIVESEEETATLTGQLAMVLLPGDFVCLYGDLGAGKTTFVRYLVAALGSSAPVSSPTFTLIHEYLGGRVPVIHMDAYRLKPGQGSSDAESTGLGEYMQTGEAVFLVEWPERIADFLPETRLDITITDGDTEMARVMEFVGHGERWAVVENEVFTS